MRTEWIFPTILIGLDVAAAIFVCLSGQLANDGVLACGGNIDRVCDIQTGRSEDGYDYSFTFSGVDV